MNERIGLIAGNGQFPILFARAASAQGKEVIAIAVREETTPELENYVQKIHWIGLGDLKQFFQILKDEKLRQAVMAGQIRPAHIFDQNIPMDEKLQRFLKRVKDKRANSMLGEIARILSRMGIKLLDSTTFLKSYLVRRGTLGAIKPSASQLADIRFGKAIAKRIGGLDIGQTVVVKDRAILAVEAIEGTDAAIARGGALAGGGAVVVKVGKPRQDMRFDIPFVGPKTIETLASASCAVLAMEAGKTFLLEQETCLKLAAENHICLAGI